MQDFFHQHYCPFTASKVVTLRIQDEESADTDKAAIRPFSCAAKPRRFWGDPFFVRRGHPGNFFLPVWVVVANIFDFHSCKIWSIWLMFLGWKHQVVGNKDNAFFLPTTSYWMLVSLYFSFWIFVNRFFGGRSANWINIVHDWFRIRNSYLPLGASDKSWKVLFTNG